MGKWIDQLIGAGRGDENPAADAAYRKADEVNRQKLFAKAHAEMHEAEQQQEQRDGKII